MLDFKSFSTRFEGYTTWFYLDVKGLVTIGIGNLVDEDQKADIFLFDYNASHAEVLNAWNTVKAHQSLRLAGGGAFKALTSVRATPESIDRVFGRKVDRNKNILRVYYPCFDTLPEAAQTGILSMSWAAGPHFPRKFPKFSQAVKSGDWATAAEECKLDETGNPGIVPRNAANKSLFLSLVLV